MSANKLQFFDTYTRGNKPFVPSDTTKGFVGLYSCGPTVYAFPHIGNLRAYVFSDTLRRVLEYNGYSVKQVINITDVGHLTSDADEGEDKIALQAIKTGKTAWEIAEFFTEAFRRDLDSLNIEKPHVLSKATDHISEQIALIKKLEERGFAYRTSDGVYFDTLKFPDYGHMARLQSRGLKAGARVAFNPEKHDLTDFALWKFSPTNQKRQMEWQSPWGIGFPGWHIECSAMSMKYLGETIDIHTGGIDHIPVHHTNEIAQSEAATGKQFVRYWLHCAFLLVDGQKMSKSLGNLFTLDDLMARGYDPMIFRYLLHTVHYRKQINFTWESLAAAKSALSSLRTALAEWPDGGLADASMVGEFHNRINDDLDMPTAVALLWEVTKGDLPSEVKKATLIEFDKVLGLQFVHSKSGRININEVPAEVQTLLKDREQARNQKNWSESDRLRDKIRSLGYVVEDARDGIQIKRSAQ
jgi:cysteinyl-tRNA synthetase